MSGIGGIVSLDGAPVEPDDLRGLLAPLARRGPAGTGLWQSAACGLGSTSLPTTPEMLLQAQPLADPASGCVITADVRLDNRDDLLAALGLSARARELSDAGLVLAAYLAWGEACVERFLGDFAFAVWDPRQVTLFGARDPFGMRPFAYHHAPGRLFAFASEARALLALPQVPCRLNQGRIADFLVLRLEGIDKTSTFFEDVWRLPPAHAVTVTRQGLRVRRYWTLEPGPELRLPSDAAYAEAFLAVFTPAVRARLRTVGPSGSMLSGGMDSGSVVAVASDLLAASGQGPLQTFSAVGPDATACVETQAIRAAQALAGLDPTSLDHTRLADLMPELEQLAWSPEEPFDCHMTLPRAVYLAARRRGLHSLLDGVGGDNVLGEADHLARLLRSGRWLTACREAVGQNRFWKGGYPPARELYRSARVAFVPDLARRLKPRLAGAPDLAPDLGPSLISPDFARQVCLGERLQTLRRHHPGGWIRRYGDACARRFDHPYLVVGRERYDRVAAAVALEPRDPFLDRRVVAFCLTLPGDQKLGGGGWPKIILRRATAGRLPDAVRWRRGKEHLGWTFTKALIDLTQSRLREALEAAPGALAPYVDVTRLQAYGRAYLETGDLAHVGAFYEAAQLAAWLRGLPRARG